jgi:hypothetical protein
MEPPPNCNPESLASQLVVGGYHAAVSAVQGISGTEWRKRARL